MLGVDVLVLELDNSHLSVFSEHCLSLTVAPYLTACLVTLLTRRRHDLSLTRL